MRATSLDLEQLIAPIGANGFLQDTWEKEPLVIHRADREYYGGLFASRDLDGVIAFSRPSFDRTALEPVATKPSTYVRGVLSDRAVSLPAEKPSIAELRQSFEQGKSLVIMAMQHRWPAIAELCRNLESAFHSPVHANLYLTPPGSQGFAAHFDTHEVFVLQLEGVKHWRLFGIAEELPLASDSVPLTRKPKTPSREITLRCGDLLYIPRGHIHEASTTDERSLHLTVGVNVYRWADLLKLALAQVSRRDVRFRRSLPGGALPSNRTELKKQFRELVELWATCLADDGTFEQALDALADQFLGQLEMLPCGQFAGQTNVELELDTVVERNLHAVCRVAESEQGAAIVFPGNRVAGPLRIASALRFVADAKRFTVRELPDDLSDASKLVLVRRLIREGLLTVTGPSVSELFFSGAILSEENHASDTTTGQLAETVGAARGQGLVG